MQNTKHGVLTNGKDHYNTTQDIADMAFAYHYSHIWVLTGKEYTMSKNHDEYSFQVSERHHKTATVTVWKRGTGKVNIIFLNNTAWVEGTEAFKDIQPGELLTAIIEIEQVLGVSVSGSPGSMGWALLKKLHPEWIEDVHSNLRDLHFTPKAGSDLIWQHPTLKAGQGLPRAGKYLHKFDKGAAYPAAAAMTDIGVGTPAHLESEAAHRASVHEKGHPQEVGVWNCTINYAPTFNPDMPPIWKEEKGSYAASEGWISGPIIRLLRQFGHEVIVHEGYVFPERHDVLVHWSKFLWDNRQACKSERARKACKQIPNTAIGFTAFKGFEDDEEEKRRPDIRLQVVSRNREIMRWNIEKVYRQQHESPVMVYMDAVYYVSNAQDGRAAFPVLVDREGKLGGFKYEGRIELTQEVQKILTQKMSVADRLEILNKIGWAQ